MDIFRNFVIVLAGMAASVHALGADTVKVAPVATKLIGSEGGRFVFGQISEYRADQVMLDTKTGRLWKLVVSRERDAQGKVVPNGAEFEVLQPVPYKEFDGRISVTPPADLSEKK